MRELYSYCHQASPVAVVIPGTSKLEDSHILCATQDIRLWLEQLQRILHCGASGIGHKSPGIFAVEDCTNPQYFTYVGFRDSAIFHNPLDKSADYASSEDRFNRYL